MRVTLIYAKSRRIKERSKGIGGFDASPGEYAHDDVFPPLGIDLVLKLTVDPAAFEAGLFLFLITGSEWLRHNLAARYPDSHWL